jgi:hypothetical protein
VSRAYHGRMRRTLLTLVVVASVGMGIGLQAAAGGAVLNLEAGSASTVGPVVPAPGASETAWEQYGAQQQAAVASVDWSTVHPAGCTVLSAVVSPLDGPTPGAPAGIVTDAVTIIGQCPTTASGPSAITPDTATCPSLVNYTGESVTSGYECVGTATINGNPNYVGAVYTYQGSSSVTGHEELGTVGSGCSPGSAVLNGGTTTLSANHYQEELYLRGVSATWTATWWQGTNPYNNWGTVCGSY